jgi:Ca-activated chloride channel family protein
MVFATGQLSMNYKVEWQQLQYLYWLIPLFICIVLWRFKMHRPVLYRYTLVQEFLKRHIVSSDIYKKALRAIRMATLGLMIVLIAKPRLVDVDSKLPVEGVDIMLVLDVSGSMRYQDEESDPRSRLEVAKDEAIRFIEKRDNDAVGLALFANDSLSRVPLTMDKQLLKRVIQEIELGFINPDGTLLFTGMLTAANRLKHSKAKSKIMILLTDGEPTDGDMSPQIVLDIVKQLGIKVYTIGIGSDTPKYQQTFMGFVMVPGVNRPLLERISQETGGRFFLARNPRDMRAIYETINALERSEQEMPVFGRWYDLFFYVGWGLLALICLELFLSTFVWFSI